MNNNIRRKYHFESTHEPYSVKYVEVETNDEALSFTIDNTQTVISYSKGYLLRKNKEMEMMFNFSEKKGYIKLLEVGNSLEFEITESDFSYDGTILHLDFKYILDYEMYVSLSIV